MLNIFRYLTVRTGGATVTALIFRVLARAAHHRPSLRVKQGKGQPIRADGPQSHLLTKKGTPTMGGLMILSGLLVGILLWGNLTNAYAWVVLSVTIGFGLVGFYDDYLKVTRQTWPAASPGCSAAAGRGADRGGGVLRLRDPRQAAVLATFADISAVQGADHRPRLVPLFVIFSAPSSSSAPATSAVNLEPTGSTAARHRPGAG